MTILITGGAGYIGSHVGKLLGERGEKIVVVDNLSTGHKEAVLFGDFIQVDLKDEAAMEELLKKYSFESVIHFAGSIVVPESISNPTKYFENNTVNSMKLIKLCEKYRVNKFIFSSTAAVYGIPTDSICDENTPTIPINPYGESKLMTEKMLQWSSLKYVALRYFNVAGADPDGKIGQSFPEATHLIKVACQAALGKRDKVGIFGTDFPTKDGSGVRDYIHVTDLAQAHLLALDYLRKENKSQILNCGYSRGYSVKEVLEKVKSQSGISFKIENHPRREGDPAELIAQSKKIREILNFKPQYDDLDFIIKTALHWEKSRPY